MNNARQIIPIPILLCVSYTIRIIYDIGISVYIDMYVPLLVHVYFKKLLNKYR